MRAQNSPHTAFHAVIHTVTGHVVVRDSDGNVLSSEPPDCISFDGIRPSFLVLGFWQYGLMDWNLFYSCLDAIIFANDRWAIFHYDEHAPGRKGALCPAEREGCSTPRTYVSFTARYLSNFKVSYIHL